MSNRIFTSYSTEDFEAAEKIYDRLASEGFEPWMDRRDLVGGQKWKDEVPNALRNSEKILVLLSPRSLNKRGYVQREIKMALEILDEFPFGRIFLIPVMLGPCEPEDYRLSEIHWVELFPDCLDSLVVSGDVASRSLPEEYDAARAFMEKIFREFGVGPAQTVVVPGNHDLNREISQDECYRPEYRKKLGDALKEGEFIEAGPKIVEMIVAEDYHRRVRHFSDFHRKIVGVPYPPRKGQGPGGTVRNRASPAASVPRGARKLGRIVILFGYRAARKIRHGVGASNLLQKGRYVPRKDRHGGVSAPAFARESAWRRSTSRWTP